MSFHITASVDTSAGNSSSSSTGDIRAAETNTADLVPPLELCIQTKSVVSQTVCVSADIVELTLLQVAKCCCLLERDRATSLASVFP